MHFICIRLENQIFRLIYIVFRLHLHNSPHRFLYTWHLKYWLCVRNCSSSPSSLPEGFPRSGFCLCRKLCFRSLLHCCGYRLFRFQSFLLFCNHFKFPHGISIAHGTFYALEFHVSCIHCLKFHHIFSTVLIAHFCYRGPCFSII